MRTAVATAALAAVTLVAGAGVWFATTAEPRLRRDLEHWLSDRLNSDVSIDSLTVRLVPTLRLEGTNLVLRIKGRPDLAPFITIRKWVGTGVITGPWTKRLELVRLEGAEIVVPPGRKADLRPLRVRDAGPSTPSPSKPRLAPLVGRLVADRVLITVQPGHADRDPVVWDVRDLAIEDFSLDGVSPWRATVDTPLPDDRAQASGTVGPWPREDLATLPLQGQYTFDGDLGAVPGLIGRVHVEGNALGALERLETSGEAWSKGLGLENGAGGRLPFMAAYQAIFDGTSGDLALSRLSSTLGSSRFEIAGRVLRQKGVRGRHVTLQAKTPTPVDLGDVLRLIVDGQRSPLAGRLGLAAALDIPAGEADVQERLTVNGTFDVARALFADPGVRSSIDRLARRGQGRPSDQTIAAVPADMQGRVRLQRRELALAEVRFVVPGVSLEGGGRYGLRTQALDFRGVAKLDASLSQTQSGARRVLLKPIDPLLRKDGAGTRLVVDVAGTRDAPKVDVDVGASLSGRP